MNNNKTLKEKVSSLLEDKIQELFIEIQHEEEIQDGGISPMDKFTLDELQESLAKHITGILERQG